VNLATQQYAKRTTRRQKLVTQWKWDIAKVVLISLASYAVIVYAVGVAMTGVRHGETDFRATWTLFCGVLFIVGAFITATICFFVIVRVNRRHDAMIAELARQEANP